MRILSQEPTLFTVMLDADGLVNRWTFAGTGHLAVATYSLEARGDFSAFTPLQMVDPKVFR